MNNYSIHQLNLDVIALEAKHQEDFERSLAQQKFSKHYKEERGTSFEDGKYDGELDLQSEPIGYVDSPLPFATAERSSVQWFNPIYRKGYLAGVTIRFNELFSA